MMAPVSPPHGSGHVYLQRAPCRVGAGLLWGEVFQLGSGKIHRAHGPGVRQPNENESGQVTCSAPSSIASDFRSAAESRLLFGIQRLMKQHLDVCLVPQPFPGSQGPGSRDVGFRKADGDGWRRAGLKGSFASHARHGSPAEFSRGAGLVETIRNQALVLRPPFGFLSLGFERRLRWFRLFLHDLNRLVHDRSAFGAISGSVPYSNAGRAV